MGQGPACELTVAHRVVHARAAPHAARSLVAGRPVPRRCATCTCAALTQNDTRVLVWHVSTSTHPTVQLVAKLRQSRPVQAIRWRHPQEGHEPVPLLVVTTWHHVAHVYAILPDEPMALRLWASIDAASDVRDISAGDAPDMTRVVALLYCDAGRLALALQHDLSLLALQEQRVLTGVATDTREAAERRATRRRQLEQYLAKGADLFLALMGDGSMVVYVLMNVDRGSPTLSQTFLSLKVPPCISTELTQPPLMLEFMPLAPLRSSSMTRWRPSGRRSRRPVCAGHDHGP